MASRVQGQRQINADIGRERQAEAGNVHNCINFKSLQSLHLFEIHGVVSFRGALTKSEVDRMERRCRETPLCEEG